MNGDTPQTPDGGNLPRQPDATPSTTSPSIATPTTQLGTDVQPQVSAPSAQQVNAAESEQTQQPASLPDANTPNGDSFPVDDEQVYGFAPDETPTVDDVTWTASEFIAHEKGATWYLALAGTTAALVVIVFLLFHDFIAIVALIFVAIIFGFLGAHKPRVLTYSITPAGLTIDKKTYAFSDFKSYGVVNEGAFSSITFMPLKRFMPTLSIYYPPDQESIIVDALSNYLPFTPATHDLIDRLMHRIRL